MPHDKNGNELKVGDKVNVEFTVTGVYPGAETCNVSLGRSIEGEQGLSLTAQAKQCELVAAAPAEPAAEQPAATEKPAEEQPASEG